jgi:hypothetical protein
MRRDAKEEQSAGPSSSRSRPLRKAAVPAHEAAAARGARKAAAATSAKMPARCAAALALQRLRSALKCASAAHIQQRHPGAGRCPYPMCVPAAPRRPQAHPRTRGEKTWQRYERRTRRRGSRGERHRRWGQWPGGRTGSSSSSSSRNMTSVPRRLQLVGSRCQGQPPPSTQHLMSRAWLLRPPPARLQWLAVRRRSQQGRAKQARKPHQLSVRSRQAGLGRRSARRPHLSAPPGHNVWGMPSLAVGGSARCRHYLGRHNA